MARVRLGGWGFRVATMVSLAVGGCGADEPARCALEVDEDFPACEAPIAGLSDAQKRRADQLVSIFENDTIELQYGYIEDIDDGRGYTAGRAGFTSATGDLVIVVERYAALVPGTDLAAFLPRLRQLAAAESASTKGLEGLVGAWTAAAEDPRFREVQDAVSDELYYDRAVCWWSTLGLSRPLSLVLLYDTNIQHGEGTDADGLPGIIARATAAVGGSPAEGAAEQAWVRAFLHAREASLAHACDASTREEWAEALPRAAALRQLVDEGNWDFAGPIDFDQPPYTPVTLP